jgi:hypothetical protein
MYSVSISPGNIQIPTYYQYVIVNSVSECTVESSRYVLPAGISGGLRTANKMLTSYIHKRYLFSGSYRHHFSRSALSVDMTLSIGLLTRLNSTIAASYTYSLQAPMYIVSVVCSSTLHLLRLHTMSTKFISVRHYIP